MKTEVEVREMLKMYERCLERVERHWMENKIGDEYYLKTSAKYSEVIIVLKDILNEV